MEILKYPFKVTKQRKETNYVPSFEKCNWRDGARLRAPSSTALSPIHILCLRSGNKEKDELMKLSTFSLK